MNRRKHLFAQEPPPLTAAQADRAVVAALQEWGPLIDRHIRSASPLGVADTQAALARLLADGTIAQDAQGRYHLTGGA